MYSSILLPTGINIITVVTWDDAIKPEKRAEVINKAREATSSNKAQTFLLANWLSNQDQYHATYEKELVNMLHMALSCGERSVKMRQSKRPSSTTRGSRLSMDDEDCSNNSMNSF